MRAPVTILCTALATTVILFTVDSLGESDLEKRMSFIEQRVLMTQEEWNAIIEVEEAEKEARFAAGGNETWSEEWKREFKYRSDLRRLFAWPFGPYVSPVDRPDAQESLPSLEAHLLRTQLLSMSVDLITHSLHGDLYRLDGYVTEHRSDEYRHQGSAGFRDENGVYADP